MGAIVQIDLSGGWGPRGYLSRQFLAWLVAVLLFAIAVDARAMRRIDAGEEPRLAPGEGLVVLTVDSNDNVNTVHLARTGGGTAEVLNYIRPGRNTFLFATEAGEYEWKEMKLISGDGMYYARHTLGGAQFRFKVEAGKIVYPGDLVLRPYSLTSSYRQVHNRALLAMDWLQLQHPALYRRLPFAYTGEYPDPFPEHYRAAAEGNTRSLEELNAGGKPPKPGELPIPADLMWQPERVVAIAINPAGDLLAEAIRTGAEEWALNLIDLRAASLQRIATLDAAPGALLWEGDRTLLAARGGGWHGRHTVYRIGQERAGNEWPVTILPITGSARVLDLLPAEPGVILMEGYNSQGELKVHRVPLAGDKPIRAFELAKGRDRLNRGVPNDRAWFTDGEGRLRVATATRDDLAVLFHGRDGVFKEVLRSDGEFEFVPLVLSYDGNTIYGLTDHDRAQREIVAFDPATRKIVRTVFAKPGVDVSSIVLNDRREPVGARYYEGGRLVTEYFDAANQSLSASLRAAFPGRTVAVIDRNADGKQLILYVDGADHPPQLYHLDLARKQASLLEDVYPWLQGKAFAPTHVIQAKGSDGLPIEAFLTLPAGNAKRPLVVYPHGGPIGVRDDVGFARDVQYLAAQGIAVLQVNFRGSEGYGKAFREAGHRALGRQIEDDIDAALRMALATYPLDESRMCTLGASYGGYSALISAIRWPGRFRCAVSMSGVSDRALRFTASDSARQDSTRDILVRLLGDPSTDLAEMQAHSPLYRSNELTLPVMLVHGREDMRVDFEHTRRLVRLLNLQKRPPTLLTIAEMGHGFDDPGTAVVAWEGIAGFLRQHLGLPTAASAAATAPATPRTMESAR